MMERNLNVDIYVEEDLIMITDNETSSERDFYIPNGTNLNDCDDLAKEIGYEILSWLDIAREAEE